MNKEQLEEIFSSMDKEILTIDGFDEAFIGFSQRCGQLRLANYSLSGMIKVLVDRDGMDEDEALEYIGYNCIGAWLGEYTPNIIEDEY